MDWADVPESVRHHFRRQRANRQDKKIDKKKKTCMLYLQVMYTYIYMYVCIYIIDVFVYISV